MNRLEAMSILVAVVDSGSLSAAARNLDMPLATVSRNTTFTVRGDAGGHSLRHSIRASHTRNEYTMDNSVDHGALEPFIGHHFRV